MRPKVEAHTPGSTPSATRFMWACAKPGTRAAIASPDRPRLKLSEPTAAGPRTRATATPAIRFSSAASHAPARSETDF